MTINICFAYDSLFEISLALEKCREEYSHEPTEDEVFSKLLIPHYVDLLIRTSNESRLSNFMLMQCKWAHIEIEKALWPSFGLF